MKIERSLMRSGWMERNQLGCVKGSLASKEGLVMASIISNITKKRRRQTELCCDVAKAHDSINHEWMLLVMQQAGVEMRIIQVVADMAEKWRIACSVEGGAVAEQGQNRHLAGRFPHALCSA